eukprot:CAMPEP_0115830866 /NCGR_PEP_ID=MMETSP0287-20121206/1841_1 /TAXON_ID=412157 /ORGANISM="Chrysochromulina rotalis, Strain UIO044" /LENGTH=37 /DNA_ID= /DNA_START= /DNA_END= /DNA_ORIENTATION=
MVRKGGPICVSAMVDSDDSRPETQRPEGCAQWKRISE